MLMFISILNVWGITDDDTDEEDEDDYGSKF